MPESEILRIGGTGQGARPEVFVHAERVTIAWIKSYGAFGSSISGFMAYKDDSDNFITEHRTPIPVSVGLRLLDLVDGAVLAADIPSSARLRRLSANLQIEEWIRTVPDTDGVGSVNLRPVDQNHAILAFPVGGAPAFMDLFFGGLFELHRTRLGAAEGVETVDFFLSAAGKMVFIVDPKPSTEHEIRMVRFDPERIGLYVAANANGAVLRAWSDTVWNSLARDIGVVSEIGRMGSGGDVEHSGVLEIRDDTVDSPEAGAVGTALRRVVA